MRWVANEEIRKVMERAKLNWWARVVAIAIVVLTVVIGSLWAFSWTFRNTIKRELKLAEKVELGGFTASVSDYGRGAPPVIIEAGLACTKGTYLDLQRALSHTTRVVTYDHAGIGGSSRSEAPRTLTSYAQELRELIAKKEIEKPYVLVGHSLGGHIVRYYANLYPDEIAGIVFLDHPHEDWFAYIRSTWSASALDHYFKWWKPEGTVYKGAALDELLTYEKNCDLVRGILPPPNIPVLMFTGNAAMHYEPGHLERDRQKWATLQESIIANSKTKKQIVDTEFGHVPHEDKPELVTREIRLFVESLARGGVAGPQRGAN